MKQYSESLVGNDAAPVVEDGARYPASPVPGSPVPSQQMGYPPQQMMPPQQMPPQQMQYPPQQMQYPPPQNMSGYITQPPPTSLPGGGPLPGQFSSDCCACCEDADCEDVDTRRSAAATVVQRRWRCGRSGWTSIERGWVGARAQRLGLPGQHLRA